ncbi:MAG: BACON domain-containing protein, partial [Bacteroidales bacterium]|nr:BACON domain-containing protein [Bacteroidales bacterium]
MKSLFKLFWRGALVLALIPGALWSCEEIENPDDLRDKVSFKLDPPEVTIPAEGGTATVSLNAPVAWKASAKDNWVSADPAKGDTGKVTVTLRADANETGESRSTEITVSATEVNASATLKVTQAAKAVVTPPEPEKATVVITIIYPSTWTGIKLYLEGADGEKPCGEKYGMDPTQVSEETHDMFGATWKVAAFVVMGNFTQPKEYTMIVSDASSIVAPEYNVTL